MTDKSQPLSGATPPAPPTCYLCKSSANVKPCTASHTDGKKYWICHTNRCGAHFEMLPAAPVAVPAGPKCVEGDRCGILVRRDGEDAPCAALLPCTIHNQPAPPALLPPPQEPTNRSRPQDYFRVPDCTCGHTRKEHAEEQPYECMVGDEEKHCGCEGFTNRPAALAGETRTEDVDEWLRKNLFDVTGFEKLPTRLAYVPKLLKAYGAAAASRIAQLERERDFWKKLAEDFNNCTLPAQLTMNLDPVLKLRAETAEAALTQAQAEGDEAMAILKKACDRDWKDEDLRAVATIASNAIYWRGYDKEDIVAQLEKSQAHKSALMEALEPFAIFQAMFVEKNKPCGGVTNDDFIRAARVYEQVKEKI